MEFIDEKIADYALRHSDEEPELLRRISRETHLNVLMPRMLSGHLQGRLLSFLSRLIKPLNILEIGTYTGYSALCLAEGLQENGTLHTIDNNPELHEMAIGYFTASVYGDRITKHLGQANEILPGLNHHLWDLVFIDADKENYLKYYGIVFDSVRPGGVIIADNVLWSGKVFAGEGQKTDRETRAIIEFNDFIANDERVSRLLLPVRDGLMCIQKKGM